MSEIPANMERDSVRRQLATRWQVPLLLISTVLFGWGVWSLRPRAPEVTYAQYRDHIVLLRKAGMLQEASRLAEEQLSRPDRDAAERCELRSILGDILYDAESKASVHNPVNLERLIRNYRTSVLNAADLTAEQLYRIGEAWEWMNRPLDAANSFEAAIGAGHADGARLRRRIIERKVDAGVLSGDKLGAELDAFLTRARAEKMRAEDVAWATERRTELYLEAEKYTEAEAQLEALRPEIESGAPEPVRNRYEFLTALVLYFQGRHDEAERVVRSLRNRMTIRDDTDAASGWLLGRLVQLHGAPETALSHFDGVCDAHFEGRYVAASKFGRAECLVALDRHDDGAAAYREAASAMAKVADSRVVDVARIGASATSAYESMQAAGKLEEALRYLDIATGLIPETDKRQRAACIGKRAELLSALGERERLLAEQVCAGAGSEEASDGTDECERRRVIARDYLVQAGDAFVAYGRQQTVDEERSSAALWKAADQYDRAGERRRTIEVLRSFVQERPGSVRVPAAILRLGQAHQALGEYRQAIACYERNVAEFRRTPAGIASVTPLAECFVALGPEHARKAEATLLSLLDEEPGRPPLITPSAAEFRDALFRLADLYLETRQFERAIVRLEEALARYPDDARSRRARFHLAQAYRQSAGRMAESALRGEAEASGEQQLREIRRRLRRARELYDQVASTAPEGGGAASRPGARLADLESWYTRLSYLYRADCAFDELEHGGSPEGYAEAIRLYDQAAWRFRDETTALSAYVQIVQCYLRMGDLTRARTTLERARWILRSMPDVSDVWVRQDQEKKDWSQYLAWLGASPLMRER